MQLNEKLSKRTFLLLACAGLAVRVILVVLRPDALGVDEVIYDPLGWELAKHGHYILNGAPATWPPGYPAFLAVVYTVFGHSILLAGILQSLLDTIAGVVLASIGIRYFGRKVGFAVLALWMFLPTRALLPSLLISEATFLPFFIIALAVFRRRGWVAAVLNGILWTAIIYTRPVALAAIIILAMGRWGYEKWRTLLPICLTALLLLPYAFWNLEKHGAFTIYTGVGINFYMGHNAHSSGGYGFPEGPQPWDTLTVQGEMAVNQVAFKAGLRDLLAKPWREAQLLVRKTALFFMSDVPILLAYAPRSEDEQMPLRQQIAARAIALRLLVALPYMAVILLAWAGFFFLNYWEGRTIWWASVATFFLASLVFVALPRYHEPLMPLLILQAGALLALPREKWRQPSKFGLRIWQIGSLGLIAIWIAEWTVVLTA